MLFQAYMFRVDYFKNTPGQLPAFPSMKPTTMPTGAPSTLFTNSAFFTSPESDTGYDVVRNGLVIDHRNGEYTVQLCPVIAGTYEIHTMLNSRGVSNQPYSVLSKFHSSQFPTGRGTYTGQYVGDGPSKAVVSHTVPSGYTTTVMPISTAGAQVGVPSTYLVTVRDPYENVVRTGTPPASVTAMLDLSPNATIDVYNYQNGSYLVTYTPQVSGDNTLSIYVGGALVQAAPVTIPTQGGASGSTFSFAVGPGLFTGRAGDASYIQVYSFDGDGNRLATYDDIYTFEVNGTNPFSGVMEPCPSPPEVGHPICDVDDALGGHYWGFYVPTISGPDDILVFLQPPAAGSRRLQTAAKSILQKPFQAVILPSAPKAEYSNISGNDSICLMFFFFFSFSHFFLFGQSCPQCGRKSSCIETNGVLFFFV